jgi:hypothetical protein
VILFIIFSLTQDGDYRPTIDNTAIWISFVSLAIAALALGWNIHRDLLKPKLKVDFGVNLLVGERGVEGKPLLVISGTNHGPGKLILSGIILRRSWDSIKKLLGRAKRGFLFYDYRHPLSSRFPCELDVGERKDFILKYDEDCFLKEDIQRIGISDSFGHIHWAKKKAYKRAKKEFEKNFQL